MYLIKFSKQADKDKKLLKGAGLEKKTRELLHIVALNSFRTAPPYESLVGNLEGYYSRRINLRHRLVYKVFKEPIEENGATYEGIVLIARMWTHYEGMR